jgi:catechol 2,3-dioxygenase-like lactoylglutathione lyase family enzyme
VKDYDETIEFYTSQPGFPLIEDTVQSPPLKRWVLVSPPGRSGTKLLPAKTAISEKLLQVENQTVGRISLFLYIDDFEDDFQNLPDPSIRIVRPPAQKAYGRIAVFADICGNLWDQIQPSRS